MRYLYNGEHKYHGTCRPISQMDDGCSNQVYCLVISRFRRHDDRNMRRQVFSIGFIWNGYGRILDIPISRWQFDTAPSNLA